MKIKNLLNTFYNKSFVQDVIKTFASKILAIFLSLITTILTTRHLGVEGRGELALATSLTTVGAQIGTLGLHSSNIYFIAKDKSVLPYVLGNSLLISLIIMNCLSLLSYIVLKNFFISYFSLNSITLLLAITNIPFTINYTLLSNILVGLYKINFYNFIELSSRFFALIITALLILSKSMNSNNLLICLILTNFLASIIIFFRLLLITPVCKISYLIFIQHFKYAFKAYLANFLASLINKIDIFIANHSLGVSKTGILSVSLTLADTLIILPSVIGTLLAPKIINKKINQRWELTIKVAKNTAIIMLIVCILSGFIAKPTIKLLFGQNFVPATTPFICLLPAVWVLSIEIVIVQYLNSLDFPIEIVYTWLIIVVVKVLLNLIFIPSMELIGISLANCISYLICLSLIFALAKFKYQHAPA